MLKQLIVDAARENDLDIFDNVFDWSLILSRGPQQRFGSEPPAAPKHKKIHG